MTCFKAFTPNRCTLHFFFFIRPLHFTYEKWRIDWSPFLHYLMTLELWHKIFGLTRLDWVPPISIIDMLTISFKSLSIIIRDKVLWQIVCLTLIRIVWQKINKRIFMEKLRTSEMVSNLFLFLFLELHYRSFLRAYLWILYNNFVFWYANRKG